MTPRKVVARNVFFLTVAKALSTPITIVNNVIMARYLGAEDFGYWFVAQAYATFAGLVITWGQGNTLPRTTAREPARASDLLGSGLVLRALVALIVLGAAAIGMSVTRPTGMFRLILILVFVHRAIACLTSTYQDVLRGFERTDIDAILNVLGPLIRTAICVVVLVPGGRLPTLLIAGIFLNFALSRIPRRALAASGVHAIWSRETVGALAKEGYPFLFYALVLNLQPAIDAAFLSKLSPPEVVGWHAVANRFVGTLCFPLEALLSSLYPVLSRLHAQDLGAYCRSTSGALRVSLLLAIPLALGCFLFPDLAIRLFSERSYGPARDNLRLLSVLLLALYVTMPLGTALLAAGGQVRWAVVQTLCVAVSVVLDPPLIRWFQTNSGNGGLGVCVSGVVSECLMVAGALWLLPRGILNKSVASSLFSAVLGGVAMAVAARSLSGFTAFVVAPVSVLAYLACLWVTGAIGRDEISAIRRWWRSRNTPAREQLDAPDQLA